MGGRVFRHNPNIEDPSGETGGSDVENPDVNPGGQNPDVDIPPVPPDQQPPAPIEEPPDLENEPDPLPIGDPKPNEPTRLV
ncbi:MAG TPA: hypothetical protein VKC34_07240 [Blastocatellia bacterium]|nr:hypothetical protein [Blastocatellia bacterium]